MVGTQTLLMGTLLTPRFAPAVPRSVFQHLILAQNRSGQEALLYGAKPVRTGGPHTTRCLYMARLGEQSLQNISAL